MKSQWSTLLVVCYSVFCSACHTKEFNDFDEACEYAESLREKYPDAVVEVSALIDV
jgi:hypothetical protein